MLIVCGWQVGVDDWFGVDAHLLPQVIDVAVQFLDFIPDAHLVWSAATGTPLRSTPATANASFISSRAV